MIALRRCTLLAYWLTPALLLLASILWLPGKVETPKALWVAEIKGATEGATDNARLTKLQPRLEAATAKLNLRAFHLVAEAVVSIADDAPAEWMSPHRDFYIKLHPKGGALAWQLFGDDVMLAEGAWKPQGETPLFIVGPQTEGGRLLFVLAAEEK